MIPGTAVAVSLRERRRLSECLVEDPPREVRNSPHILPLLAKHMTDEQPEGRNGMDEAHCQWAYFRM